MRVCGMLVALVGALSILSSGVSGEEPASAKPDPKPMIGAYYFGGWSGKSGSADNPKEPWARNAPTHLSRRMVEEFPQREPVWGWRDDSMETMERQIALAADHGLGFFAFCWYWHDNAKAVNKKAIREDPKHTSLDLFVKARNNPRMKFCLLVANHQGFEIKGPENWKAAVEAWLPYLKHKQYLTVGGRPLIIIFAPAGVDKEALAAMQDTARKAGLPGLAIAGCGGGSPETGFTHRTHYNVAPGGGAAGSEAHKYAELAAANQQQWKGTPGQPYIPIVTAGWDKRPWEGPMGLYNQPAGWYYPDRTPEQFANFLRDAIRWMDKHPDQTTVERLVLIYAWNEFGEGGYIAPTRGDADGKYLKALQRVAAPQPRLGKPVAPAGANTPPAEYSFSLWLNGWPKVQADFAWMRSPKGSPFVYPRWEDWPRNPADQKLPWHFTPPTVPSIFAVATNRYEFTLDPSDFRKGGFARVSKPAPGYAEAAREDTAHLHRLPAAEVIVELQMGGRTFRAARCGGAARMWESGRFVQRYDFPDLELADAGGALPCNATLELVVWPDSLTLTTRLAPHKKDHMPAPATSAPADKEPAPQWSDAKLRVGITGKGIDCVAEQAFEGKWQAGVEKSVTATFRAGPRAAAADISLAVSAGEDQTFPVTFEPTMDCFVALAPKLKRTFQGGPTDIRDYDEFRISIDNRGTAKADVPFLLHFRDTANIAGLVPMLCDAAGRPTGIPVQLSKNWHQGTYLMAYALLPAPPGRTEYILRIVYGFYGNVPSASHSQLSLIGWGGYGRWDQLAIGCWGETFCLDMDMTNLRTVIADVRTLMVRNGREGRKWGWSDAQWGGDWLGLADAAGKRLAFGDLKTAYVAHGPCLSDVRYAGFYGPDRDVALQAQVHILRTDDYARIFHNLKYTFGREAKVEGSWLFRMGGGGGGLTPTVAYGNEKGLIDQHKPPATLKPRDVIADRVTLGGKGPWWVAFPDANFPPGKMPTGARALIIRSYRAVFDGKEHTAPTITLLVNRVQANGLNIELVLVPPKDVATFRPGDTAEMSVEWITLPRVEEDYYGPNEAFRKHLAASGTSWKTTYREAAGNDLAVTARGGKVLRRYPVIIHADEPTVEVSIKGGVGYVPIRFEGLKSIDGVALYEVVGGKEIRLDQAVHGSDFWQTDYDAAAKTYSLTYNLPLDNKPQSTWRLR